MPEHGQKPGIVYVDAVTGKVLMELYFPPPFVVYRPKVIHLTGVPEDCAAPARVVLDGSTATDACRVLSLHPDLDARKN